MRAAAAACIAAAVAVLTYSNSLDCGFVFDDHLAIETNDDVTTPPSEYDWRLLWRRDFWGKDLTKFDSHKSWRPIVVLTFRLQAQAQWNETDGAASDAVSRAPPPDGGDDKPPADIDARPFHGVNVGLHALVSAGVALLAGELVPNDGGTASLVSGVVFAAHPVHVEVRAR
jgi:hypothetical protein